jgi:hypothetical protein
MGIFTPVKKHANKFRYTPRYYDPEQERRDQRRMELRGTSSHDEGEYTPGQYIRTQREARRLAKSNKSKSKIPSVVFLILVAVVVLVVFALVPRIVQVFSEKRLTTEEIQQRDIQEFDPYTPITIVPNDYKEE